MKYDIVIAGGGLAGASLGMALAARGARVVIVEHQPTFRDRIYGEVTHPSGQFNALYCQLRGAVGFMKRQFHKGPLWRNQHCWRFSLTSETTGARRENCILCRRS